MEAKYIRHIFVTDIQIRGVVPDLEVSERRRVDSCPRTRWPLDRRSPRDLTLDRHLLHINHYARPPHTQCVRSSRMSILLVRVCKHYHAMDHCLRPCFTEKRKAEAERIRQKYPDRIPVRLLCS